MSRRLRVKPRLLPRPYSLCFAAAISLLPALRVYAQGTAPDWELNAGGNQQFEVASVRENKVGGTSTSSIPLDSGNTFSTIDKTYKLNPEGSLFSAKNWTLLTYIAFAYKLTGTQYLALRFDFYSGLGLHVPAFARNGRFDIEGRAPASATKDQMRLMMQNLLAERFKLAVHWETREAPVFALKEAKTGILGPQLAVHRASDDCSAAALPGHASETTIGTPSPAALPIPCGMIAHLPASAPENRRFGGRDVPLTMLAESLGTQAGLAVVPRPVIDETGLKGAYDFWMEWTPDDTSEVNNHESGGTFRQGLKDQLGLKLGPVKGPVQVLVIVKQLLNKSLSGHHPSTRLLIPLYLEELEKAAEQERNSPNNPNRKTDDMSDDELLYHIIAEIRKATSAAQMAEMLAEVVQILNLAKPEIFGLLVNDPG